MGLGVGSSAVPMQGTVASSSGTHHWLEGLARSADVPGSAKWERIHSDDGLKAFGTQSKLGKWINFRIDDLHEDAVVVAPKIAAPARVKY